jgi:hypothetical protein
MKKLTTTLTAFFYAIIIIWAQPSVITVPLDNNLQMVTDMIQTSNGDFIITGINMGHSVVTVTCLSDEGEILWSSYLQGYMDWFTNIAEKSDGNLLIPMSDPNSAKLVELNQTGDSVNCLYISETNHSFFSSVIEINDSLIIAAEIIRNCDPWFPGFDSSLLVKIDEEFNLNEKIPSPFTTIKSLTKTSDTSFFALITSKISNEPSYIKYNLNGDALNSSTCSNSSISLFQHRIFRVNDNYLFAIGFQMENNSMKAHLSKFDQTGEVEYCNSYNNPYFMSLTHNAASEKIFAVGNHFEICTIYCMDYAGNPISSFTLNDSLIGNTIIFDAGNFYLAGHYDGSEVNAVGSRFLIINADSVFSVAENFNNLKIVIYPNPAKDKITITNNSDILRTETISIFKINGQKVMEQNFQNQKLIEINVSTIPQGIYLLKIQSPGITEFRKLIKQ